MSKEPAIHAAHVLLLAMKAKGLDAKGLAEATGIHINLVSRYCTGEVAVGLKNAPIIAQVLGVTVESLLYPLGVGTAGAA